MITMDEVQKQAGALMYRRDMAVVRQRLRAWRIWAGPYC